MTTCTPAASEQLQRDLLIELVVLDEKYACASKACALGAFVVADSDDSPLRSSARAHKCLHRGVEHD